MLNFPDDYSDHLDIVIHLFNVLAEYNNQNIFLCVSIPDPHFISNAIYNRLNLIETWIVGFLREKFDQIGYDIFDDMWNVRNCA